MKKIYILIMIVCFVLTPDKLEAQNTFEGNVTLTTQVEVDAFVSENYDQINGFLIINGGSNITDLSGLSSLTVIASELLFENNFNITNLDFFSNLISFSSLRINNNPILSNVSGLSNISGVQSIEIKNNGALINVNGILASPILITGNIEIQNNPSLSSLSGLSSIEGVVSGNVKIVNNDALINLNGLQNISQINGSFWINGHSNLVTINDLQIASIGSQLSVQHNPALGSLIGLGSLTNIGFYFVVVNNDSIENLEGLENLQSIGQQFIIQDNQNLVSLAGLNSLSHISLNLYIHGNANLTSLNGFQNLTYIGQNVIITANDSLNSLVGLNNINSTVFLYIQNNYSLPNLNGLQGLTNIGVLNIQGNENLEDINGLINVTEMSAGSLQPSQRDIIIKNNNSLTNLDGLSSMLFTTGNLIEVKENTSLVSFCGFLTMFNNNGFTGTFDVSGNSYNPTIQNIIDGSCTTQIPSLSLTYPQGGDFYIERRKLRLQVKSDIILPPNQQFDISYSTDEGDTWISDGYFERDAKGGDFWLLPSVSEPTEFLVKLNTVVYGNEIIIVSDSFSVQPINYYMNEGYINDGVSQIEFTSEDGLSNWEQRASIAHTCMDNFSQDWYHKKSPMSSCGREIHSPIDGIIMAIKPNYISNNCGSNYDANYGKQIVIQSIDDKTMALRFAHLKEIDDTLELGDTINKYQRIGQVGGSGTQYPHLHTSLYKNIYEWIDSYIDEETGESLSTTIKMLKKDEIITATDGDIFLCLRLAKNYSAEFEFITNENEQGVNEESNSLFEKVITNKNELISIIPNPVGDRVMGIKNISEIEITRIEIFSVSGEKVFEQVSPSSLLSIPYLTNGLYLVKLYLADETLVLKKLMITS